MTYNLNSSPYDSVRSVYVFSFDSVDLLTTDGNAQMFSIEKPSKKKQFARP